MGVLLRTTQTTKENDEKSQGRNRAEQDDDDPDPLVDGPHHGPLSEPPFGQLRTQMMLGSDDSDGVVFSTVLSYCMLILGGPIATFFVTKVGILSGLMGWDPEDNWTTVTS